MKCEAKGCKEKAETSTYMGLNLCSKHDKKINERLNVAVDAEKKGHREAITSAIFDLHEGKVKEALDTLTKAL